MAGGLRTLNPFDEVGQQLHPEPPDLDPDAVATALRSYHPELAGAATAFFAASAPTLPGCRRANDAVVP